jgi:fucose permease
MSDFRRGAGTWLCYAFLAFYSFFLNSMGPITPLLKSDLGLSYTVGGLHYSAFALGILVLGFAGSGAVARIGMRRALWAGALGLALGTVPLVLGRSPFVTIPASFAMGLFGSLILIVVPSKLAVLHGDMLAVALSEANLLASAVAAAAPVMLGVSTKLLGNWRPAPALMALLPIVLFLPLRRLLAEAPSGASVAAVSGASSGEARAGEKAEAARRGGLPRAYWIYWICLVLGVAAEFGMVSWSSDFFATVHGVDKALASGSISLFLAAMILGRGAGSFLARRFDLGALIAVQAAVAFGGFFLFWLGGGLALALIGLFLTGLGISGLYPFLLSLAIAAAGEQRVRASSVATLASGIAIMSLPLLLGSLADAFGIRDAYVAVPCVLLALTLMLGVARAAAASAKRKATA